MKNIHEREMSECECHFFGSIIEITFEEKVSNDNDTRAKLCERKTATLLLELRARVDQD